MLDSSTITGMEHRLLFKGTPGPEVPSAGPSSSEDRAEVSRLSPEQRLVRAQQRFQELIKRGGALNDAQLREDLETVKRELERRDGELARRQELIVDLMLSKIRAAHG